MQTRAALAVLSAIVLLAGCSSPSDQSSASSTSSSASTSAQPSAAGPIRSPQPAATTPVIGSVIAPPVPVPATDGKVHLVYELQLTNVVGHELTLTSATVLDRDVSLLNLTGDQLAHWTKVLGNPAPTDKIGPGQAAVVWFDVAIDKGAAVPKQLTHSIGISNSQPQVPLFPAIQTVNIAPVTVETHKPVVVHPPLTGPNWVDGDGCCDTSAHRSALNPIDGQLWAAERFAIDYVQLQPDHRLVTGDPTKLESYPYYGADIHAAGDGTVVGVLDGLPEETPGTAPTGLALDQYSGNHVVEDLGGGNFALYAHIKTGTVKVKPGDRLTTGQVIGLVGNTGNSDAPHLHFHVMSTPDPLRSNGLPFVFTAFGLDDRIGTTKDLTEVLDGKSAPMTAGFAAQAESNVMPLELDVMTYGER